MTDHLYFIPLLPLLFSFVLMFMSRGRERNISRTAMVAVVSYSILVIAQVGNWALGHHLEFTQPLFHWDDYRFDFSLHMDHPAAVFLLVTACLGGLVMRFSHYYMHREPGQARFFATILCLLTGMSTIALAADFNTLFLGWEVVGISSFVLIGFYRHREYPSRNGLKVFCVYRLCDIGLFVSSYVEHHDLGSSFFRDLAPLPAPHALLISLLLLLSAAGKSGQFPFSFWVPRAMEGPTPSSAIFYGALSIHAGVFLLLRTMPIWIGCPDARLWIGMVGLATAFLASGISHVQSNVKGQIGYASVAQVGLMFVELALGWDKLVLYHFVGNASLRCYQLLVSPSVVAYLLKLQSTRSAPTRAVFPGLTLERLLPGKLRSSLFVLTSQEAYMELALNRSMFWLPQWTARNVFLENRSISQVWNRSVLLMVVLAALASRGDFWEAWPFLAGVLGFYLLGLLGIRRLPAEVRSIKLDRYYGYGAVYPTSARMLFVSFLGMSGFPISPAFYGQDLLLASAMHLSPVLAAVLALGVIFNGMVLARCFSRLFLGVERVRWKAALES